MLKIIAARITPCATFCATLIVLMAGLLLWDAGHLPAGEFRTAFVSFLEKWQTLTAGVLALIGAGWTIWYIRKDIAQSQRIADREHALAMRESYSTLRDRIDLLVTRPHRWVDNVNGGRQMMAPRANVKVELMMEDPELNRLEAVARFRTLRTRIALDTSPWQRAKQRVPVTDLQEELLAVLNDIYRRLDRGQAIQDIARDLDG